MRPKKLILLVVLPLLVIWFTFTVSRESSVQDGLTVYGFVSERFAQLLVQPAGHESPQGLLTPVITAAVVLLPLLAGCSFSRKPERWLPFALGFAVFMLAPRYVFTAPPHDGTLDYERYCTTITGAEWRANAEKALHVLRAKRRIIGRRAS